MRQNFVSKVHIGINIMKISFQRLEEEWNYIDTDSPFIAGIMSKFIIMYWDISGTIGFLGEAHYDLTFIRDHIFE